jgi:hypothetical protein
MLRLLLFIISLSAFARPPATPPLSGFQGNLWQQAQSMHLQTQQQLQAQDQYRRQLLLQDQQLQIDQLEYQQDQMDRMQRSATMHQYSDHLKQYSDSVNARPKEIKKKH